MRFTFPCLLGIGLLILHLAACSKSDTVTDGKGLVADTELVVPVHHCGEVVLLEARGVNGVSLGVFEIQNDSTEAWFTFSPDGERKLEEIAIYAGELNRIPKLSDGSPDASHFPVRKIDLQRTKPISLKIAIPKADPCVFLSAYLRLSNGADTISAWLTNENAGSGIRGFKHCFSPCTDADVACDLAEVASPPVTLTQSAWTNKFDQPYAGMLETDFAKLFPKGLSLGCNNKVTFTSAKDILNVLPLSGAPKGLKGDLTNPSRAQCDNQLVGELCALMLTTKFDEAFESFSKPKVRLSQLEVRTGAFADWKVEEVIQEANAVLGNCASNYTPNQLYEVLSDINRNASRTDSVGAFLGCPDL